MPTIVPQSTEHLPESIIFCSLSFQSSSLPRGIDSTGIQDSSHEYESCAALLNCYGVPAVQSQLFKRRGNAQGCYNSPGNAKRSVRLKQTRSQSQQAVIARAPCRERLTWFESIETSCLVSRGCEMRRSGQTVLAKLSFTESSGRAVKSLDVCEAF